MAASAFCKSAGHLYRLCKASCCVLHRVAFCILQPEGKAAAQRVGLTADEAAAVLGPPLPQVACNDAELTDARWFSRNWLSAALSGAKYLDLNHVHRPSTSISQRGGLR